MHHKYWQCFTQQSPRCCIMLRTWIMCCRSLVDTLTRFPVQADMNLHWMIVWSMYAAPIWMYEQPVSFSFDLAISWSDRSVSLPLNGQFTHTFNPLWLFDTTELVKYGTPVWCVMRSSMSEMRKSKKIQAEQAWWCAYEALQISRHEHRLRG